MKKSTIHKYIFSLALFINCTALFAQSDFRNFLTHIDSLTDPGAKSAAADSFMAYARTKGIPFVEGDTVNFIYRGIGSSISLAGDMNSWTPGATPMTRISGTNFCYCSQQYEPDARLDYKFVIDGNWFLDPENSRTIAGGYGPNSELAMPGYVQPWEIKYKSSIPHGTLVPLQIYSAIVGTNYNLSIYLPPGYDSAKTYPTVYFQDGSDYLAYGNSKNIIDNLLDSNLIRPFIGIFVTPNNRNEEYAGSIRTSYRLFFVNELVPYIDSIYPTRKEATQRLVIGDSYGGNISALICYYHSDVFGNVGVHSGAFQPNNFEVCALFRDAPAMNIKVASVWGVYEQGLTQNMRDVRDSLINKGYKIQWSEVHEGHSWGNWRGNTDFILEYIFPALPTGIASQHGAQPEQFQLHQNYPNPFNPATTITYTLASSEFVSLKIYNALGQELSTLVNGRQEPGTKSIRFDGTNIPSGVYLCRLTAGLQSEMRKMLLIR